MCKGVVQIHHGQNHAWLENWRCCPRIRPPLLAVVDDLLAEVVKMGGDEPKGLYTHKLFFFLGGFWLDVPTPKNRHSKFIHLGWLQKFGSSLWYPNLQWFKYVSVTLGHFFLAAQGTFFLLKHFLFTSWMLVIKSSVLVWMLLLAASVLALAEALVAKGETLKTQLRSCHSPSKCGG